MLSRFSFSSGEPDKNSLNVESVKRQDLDTELVRLNLAHTHGPKVQASSSE
jgi:hypothetical protein